MSEQQRRADLLESLRKVQRMAVSNTLQKTIAALIAYAQPDDDASTEFGDITCDDMDRLAAKLASFRLSRQLKSDLAAEREANAGLSADLTVWQSTAESLKAELAAVKAKGDALAEAAAFVVHEPGSTSFGKTTLWKHYKQLKSALAAYRADATKQPMVDMAFQCSACKSLGTFANCNDANSVGWTYEKDYWGWRCPKCSTPAETQVRATDPFNGTCEECGQVVKDGHITGKQILYGKCSDCRGKVLSLWRCESCFRTSANKDRETLLAEGWTTPGGNGYSKCPTCNTTPPTSPESAKADEWRIVQVYQGGSKFEAWKGNRLVAVFFDGESDARRFAASAEMVALLERCRDEYTCHRFTDADNVRDILRDATMVLAKVKGTP